MPICTRLLKVRNLNCGSMLVSQPTLCFARSLKPGQCLRDLSQLPLLSAAKWILSTHSRSSPSANKMQWNERWIQSTCLRHFAATKLQASGSLAVFTNSAYWVPEDQGGGFSFIAFVHFSTKASEEFVLPWRRSSSFNSCLSLDRECKNGPRKPTLWP